MIFNAFGPPDVLHYEDVPDPAPGPGDLLIEVHAVSVNRVLDVDIRAGRAPHYGVEPPHILGVDPSGVVIDVGSDVQGFAAGDRVSVTMGMPGGGRYGLECNGGDAQLTIAPAASCVKVRDEIGFADATVISRHGPVAYNLLFNMGKLEAGQTVLIMGAAGNLGSIGIQLAKAAGATVIAAAGSRARADVGASLGADHTVDYNAVNLKDAVMDITDGAGVDLFYDNIANPDICPLGIESLKVLGRMVTAGSHGGPVVPVDFSTVYHKQLTIMGNPRSKAQDALPCFDAAAAGNLKVVIDRVVPLSAAPEMHALIEADPGIGKVIL
ncbi:MAG: zinc-binding alcohol dehydrogenase family protein, partial [Rhodospirillaceae bacterium]|nr:zinc-binding alcohol dehydrogenase family protein [Rhodospirillaceae bacterium]